MQDNILKLVEPVEDHIKKELNWSKGSIMFDAYSKGRVHYVALSVSYVKEVTSKQWDETMVEKVQCLALLTLSLMANLPNLNYKEFPF